MLEHESWCCRSPESPCAKEGGCSSSCNCGADESIEPIASMPGAWRMWAHRYDNGLYYHLGERLWVKLHGLSEPIVEVDVLEVEDDDPSATHWAWMKTGESEPLFSHPYRDGVEICFIYGTKIEVERGKGRMVRLAVTPVAKEV